jgi:cell division GTPase FtsZ
MYIDALANKKEPEELLQLALDIVRCMFEPNPVGTWLLNGNPDFLDDVINKENDSNISYSSSSLSTTDNFSNHITETIVPSLEYQGYQPSPNQTIYTIITTHSSHLNTNLVEATSSAITDAFDINDDTTIHIGYCHDDAITDTVRVSVIVVG